MTLFNVQLQRLQELRKLRPQFAEIYDFHRDLCTFLQGHPCKWLSITSNPDQWEPRRQAGFPLLTGDALQFDPEETGNFIAELAGELITLGRDGKEELQRLIQAQTEGALPVDRLLVACLEKNRAPLDACAAELNIPSALLEYVCSTSLAYGLQSWLKTVEPPHCPEWKEGYCPICGGTPVMGELAGEEGQKLLHCSICASNWSVSRLRCTYCGNEETSSLEYFTAEGETGYRVDLCRKCSGYLKVVDSRELGKGLPMDVEDLNTLHLDLIAQQEGLVKGKKVQNL